MEKGYVLFAGWGISHQKEIHGCRKILPGIVGNIFPLMCVVFEGFLSDFRSINAQINPRSNFLELRIFHHDMIFTI